VQLEGPLTGSQTNDAFFAAGDAAAGRKDLTIVVQNSEGTVVAKYFLTQAWPSDIRVTGLKAGSSDILNEDVTFTAANIQRQSP
jgi:phage tail-like protein